MCFNGGQVVFTGYCPSPQSHGVFSLHFLFPHYDSACSTKSANVMGIDDAAMRLKCITKHKVVIKIKLNKCRKREDLRMIKGTGGGRRSSSRLKPIKRLGNSYNNNRSSIVCSAHTKRSSSARKTEKNKAVVVTIIKLRRVEL